MYPTIARAATSRRTWRRHHATRVVFLSLLLSFLAVSVGADAQSTARPSPGDSAVAIAASAHVTVPPVLRAWPDGVTSVTLEPGPAASKRDRGAMTSRPLTVSCASNVAHRLVVRRAGGETPEVEWSADGGRSWERLSARPADVRSDLEPGHRKRCAEVVFRLAGTDGQEADAGAGSPSLRVEFALERSPAGGSGTPVTATDVTR